MSPDNTNPRPQPTVNVANLDADYSLVPERPTPASAASRTPDQDATANIARQQLDAIYSGDRNAIVSDRPNTPTATQVTSTNLTTDGAARDNTPPTTVSQQPATNQPTAQILSGRDRFANNQKQPSSLDSDTDNPYNRNYEDVEIQAGDKKWQQYHSAWQQYYQQYFHQYYSGHIQQMQAALEQKNTNAANAADGITPEQAMADISNSLKSKIQQRAKKIRKSRHFMPIAAALGVMLVFSFLQYNRIFFSNIYAYAVPSSLDSANLIIDPASDPIVGPEPRLLIPKVNIDVPVVWDTRPDHASQMAAMEKGVAWFGIPGANSRPGQVGNTVLSGHSSNDFLESGNYKFVFAPLHRVTEGDTIHINYEGLRYTYVVKQIEVVKPTDVDALRRPTDKPILTLITCTPLGTALNRLLVVAEQVLPNPADAAPEPSANEESNSAAEMPGIQPTIIERMFGAS